MVDKNNITAICEKMHTSIMGFAIGDALGVPAEFQDRKTRNKTPITDMVGFGSHEMPAGTWSDDTSMVLATMDSITQLKKIDYDDIMKRFVLWYKEAEYTACGEVFDMGLTTKRAIDRYIQGKKYDKCGTNSFYENGNGSLMRVLPLAIFFTLLDLDEREKTRHVYYLSSLTHGHEISLLGCRIYCDLYEMLIEGKSIKETHRELPVDIYNRYYDEAIGCYKRIVDGSIFELGEDSIKSSGYIVDTLEAAIWCLANSCNYKEAVIKAVNLGGDTDTIAAITGSLAGIVYGSDSIPSEWLELLKQRSYIDKMTADYLNTVISINTEE